MTEPDRPPAWWDEQQQEPPDEPKRRGARWLVQLAGLLIGAVAGTGLTVLLAVVLLLPGKTTVQLVQPPAATASAGGYSGYGAALKRVERFIDSSPGYQVLIGRVDAGEVARGLAVDVPAGWEPGRGMQADWKPDAVVLRFPAGAEVHVPVKTFLDKR